MKTALREMANPQSIEHFADAFFARWLRRAAFLTQDVLKTSMASLFEPGKEVRSRHCSA